MDIDSIKLFRSKIRVLEREVERQLDAETGCCGVSMPQCHILLELDKKTGTSIIDLAGKLYLDKSTLSRTVDGMVRKGWISREINPGDRRYMIVRLTQQGQATADRINQLCNQYYRELFNLIPENRHNGVMESMGIISDAMVRLHKRQEDKTSRCEITPE